MKDLSSVILNTPRLILRELVKSDFTEVHEYASDPEVVKYQAWGPNSEADTDAFLDNAIDTQSEDPRSTFEFAIVERENLALIGAGGIRIQNIDNFEADFGYTLNPKFWGKGFATEAAREILKFGFVNLCVHRIWATARPDNAASIKVLEKLGLRQEGLLRKNMWIRGQWCDSCLYAILEEEFFAQ